jgi:hypothetical protein
MKLEYKDYEFSKKIVDETLKLDDVKIEPHIQVSLKSFICDMDTSDYDVRSKIFLFLQHISSLFLNYCINSEVYFLSKEEIEKSYKGRDIIAKMCKDFRETGF